MGSHVTGGGGTLEQLSQMGISEMDLLKLAASNGLPDGFRFDGYGGHGGRTNSAEVQRAQAQAAATFVPSWPPNSGFSAADRDPVVAFGGGQNGMPALSQTYMAAQQPNLAQHGINAAAADLNYLTQLGVGSAAAASTAAFGEGPRIYVGGVPDLVTVAMVRDHFSRWGVVRDVHFPKERTSRRRRHFCFVTFESLQAAERAVAESNREIGGYPVAAINIPTDRLTHYGLRQASALASPTAQLRAGLPFGSASSSSLIDGGGGLLQDAYGSPSTRSQSYGGGTYNVTHQVGAKRISGTASVDCTQQDMAAHLAGVSEHELAATLAALRMGQQDAARGGGSSGVPSGASTRQTSQDFSSLSGGYGGHNTAAASYSAPQDVGGGFPGNLSVNPATGGDIYTVLANLQRNSSGRSASSPHMHIGMPGGSLGLSVGHTPLGTPPDSSRPGSGFELAQAQAMAALKAQQAAATASMSQGYGFLSGPQEQEDYARARSFDGGHGHGATHHHASSLGGSLRATSASYGHIARGAIGNRHVQSTFNPNHPNGSASASALPGSPSGGGVPPRFSSLSGNIHGGTSNSSSSTPLRGNSFSVGLASSNLGPAAVGLGGHLPASSALAALRPDILASMQQQLAEGGGSFDAGRHSGTAAASGVEKETHLEEPQVEARDNSPQKQSPGSPAHDSGRVSRADSLGSRSMEHRLDASVESLLRGASTDAAGIDGGGSGKNGALDRPISATAPQQQSPQGHCRDWRHSYEGGSALPPGLQSDWAGGASFYGSINGTAALLGQTN